MSRPKKYKPEFKGPIEGWVVNQLTRGPLAYWRVERTLSREEVMQEAYECFLRCGKKFPKSPEYNTPQAFMALFKMAWRNQFTDLANYDTDDRRCLNTDAREIQLDEPVGSLENDGFLAIMIREAPAEVRTVLSVFLNAPSELLDLAFDAWRIRGRNSAGGSRHLNQLLGLDPSRDPVKLVEEYFTKTSV
jgi:hypothetical protein